jgi:MFS family permease
VASASAVMAMVILAASTRLPLIYLGSFLRGVADTTILASSYELASVFIPPEQRARRYAWFNATFFLSWGLPGTFIVGPLVDFLISRDYAESCAYRISFAFAAGLVLLGLIVQSVLVYSVKQRRDFKVRMI